MRALTLPEPARSLYKQTHDLLDRWLPDALPDGGVWTIGGGTVLGALWGHRNSTDLDIFLPSDSGMAAISPEWNPEFANRMGERGASAVRVQTRGLKFEFASGRVELTALDLNPPLNPMPVEIGGLPRYMSPIACILTGKLAGRGLRLPPRDVFDIAVAAQLAPDALACAVNHLQPQNRVEITTRLAENADAYRAAAGEAILRPDLQWEHLIEDGPEAALSAIRDLVYRDVSLDFEQGRAQVTVANDAQGRITRKYNSPEALLAGATAMGIRPFLLGPHGTVDRFLKSTARKFTSPGFDP